MRIDLGWQALIRPAARDHLGLTELVAFDFGRYRGGGFFRSLRFLREGFIGFNAIADSLSEII